MTRALGLLWLSEDNGSDEERGSHVGWVLCHEEKGAAEQVN